MVFIFRYYAHAGEGQKGHVAKPPPPHQLTLMSSWGVSLAPEVTFQLLTLVAVYLDLLLIVSFLFMNHIIIHYFKDLLNLN